MFPDYSGNHMTMITLRDMAGRYEPVLNENGITLIQQNDITLNSTVKIVKNLENWNIRLIR